MDIRGLFLGRPSGAIAKLVIESTWNFEILRRLKQCVLEKKNDMMLRMNKSDHGTSKVSPSYIMQLRHLWDPPAMQGAGPRFQLAYLPLAPIFRLL